MPAPSASAGGSSSRKPGTSSTKSTSKVAGVGSVMPKVNGLRRSSTTSSNSKTSAMGSVMPKVDGPYKSSAPQNSRLPDKKSSNTPSSSSTSRAGGTSSALRPVPSNRAQSSSSSSSRLPPASISRVESSSTSTSYRPSSSSAKAQNASSLSSNRLLPISSGNQNSGSQLSRIQESYSSNQVQAPPTRVGTLFNTQRDHDMAARQTRYSSLTAIERQEQDIWVQIQLRLNLGNCPAGFDWIREESCGVRRMSGYHCAGGSHFVSDQLIAEGLGRFYVKEIHDSQGRTKRLGDLFDCRQTVWNGPFTDLNDVIHQIKARNAVARGPVFHHHLGFI